MPTASACAFVPPGVNTETVTACRFNGRCPTPLHTPSLLFVARGHLYQHWLITCAAQHARNQSTFKLSAPLAVHSLIHPLQTFVDFNMLLYTVHALLALSNRIGTVQKFRKVGVDRVRLHHWVIQTLPTLGGIMSKMWSILRGDLYFKHTSKSYRPMIRGKT